MDASDLVSLAELGRIAFGAVVLGIVVWVIQARRAKARSGRRARPGSRRS